jgi:hypothetical protein
MVPSIVEGVARVLAAGGGECCDDERYLPLAQLESGAVIGLDAAGRWVTFRPDLGLVRWGDGNEPRFTEAVETKRETFESQLAASAVAAGLDGDAVVLAFPSVELVRALLQKRSVLVCRLALLWVLPSELRELRSDIAEVASDKYLPRAIRELASRLVVPE